MSSRRVWTVLLVLNLPVYWWVFRQWFPDLEDIGAALSMWLEPKWMRITSMWLRVWDRPLWADAWSYEMQRENDASWSAFKLILALLSCAAIVTGEYSALAFFAPHLLR